MQVALDLGQRAEHGERTGHHTFGEPRLRHQADDVRVGPHDHVVVGRDDRPGAGDAAPEHGLGAQVPARQRQAPEQGEHLAHIGSGVEEAAERHVAGDPREAVEPGDGLPGDGAVGLGLVVGAATLGAPGPPGAPVRRGLERAHCRIRATAQAAPKPLSMPTTLTPAAQEASIASRAVIPPNDAP